ncbi:MAG: deoxyhypusine synthase [Candidatus Pacearchaeota archaeon]|nr:MAG: deoxyhypusine synthase [Candidatus Pacearchaeota archaeon]
MEKVRHIKITKEMKVKKLVKNMKNAGFGARKIGLASEIFKKIFYEEKCDIFLGIAGAMVPAGMKEIIIDMIKTKKIKAIVITGANLTHDLAEALGENHYHCDVWNDIIFQKKGYDRIYNVFMKNLVYKKIEKFLEKNWSFLKNSKNNIEFYWLIGKILKNQNSIFSICYSTKTPIFCPTLLDSGLGLMLWSRIKSSKYTNIDFFNELSDFINIVWTKNKKAVIYIGGGTPKNFIQQALQFSGGADYGVQITTEREEFGGSSGAPLEEGISWGKLKTNSKKDLDFVDVICDATIALPIIWSYVKN